MSNNPLRRDYEGRENERPLDSRGWLVVAALALGLIGAGVQGVGGDASVLFFVAVVLGIAGLIGMAVRD